MTELAVRVALALADNDAAAALAPLERACVQRVNLMLRENTRTFTQIVQSQNMQCSPR